MTPVTDGWWPELPAGVSGLVDDFTALGQTVPPARSEFVSELRSHFVRSVRVATDVHVVSPGPSSIRLPAWLTTPRRGWALPAAAVAIVMLISASIGLGPKDTAAPPQIDRETLVARNARAWSDVTTLTGAFDTGDGWYFEEWISRSQEGAPRFKRFIRPPSRTTNGPQWNMSDGRTEWVVDGISGDVRVARDAVPGDFTAVVPNDAMQCTSLALPPTTADGPDPMPAVLDGRAVYRLSGHTADGSIAVFWIDADDALVRRIDRPGFGTVWQRRRLDLGSPLNADIFRPDNLTNL